MWDMTEDMTHDRNPKPLIHASLRLFTRLRSLSTDGEANDDLADAWAEAQKTLSEGIIKVFRNIGPLSASGCHPRGNEADLLTRTVSYLSAALIEDPANLLPMLNSSKPAQLASYNLYRQTIPKAMEDLALEVALGEKKADLPQGLLKHLSWGYATKSLRKKAEWFDLNRRRSYLLTWRTIFDFFEHASITVKDQLTAEIKERGLVPAFLDYLYELLQLPNGRLIDGSKFDLRAFKFDQSTSDEKEEKWFGVHVYYLCLRYLPNLVTAWWNESKNRVKGPIEAWTEKYFSPLVIEDALKTVQEWASSQDWSNEDQSMDVKVSFNAKEIVASIEIDEDSPPSSICISMPSAYPLHLPVVEGRTRIAVSEKKWQSWIRTIAGAVKFQGSLIDALIIFRRNIQGALKGQTECAICYSVVSPSMKLPNKKCATYLAIRIKSTIGSLGKLFELLKGASSSRMSRRGQINLAQSDPDFGANSMLFHVTAERSAPGDAQAQPQTSRLGGAFLGLRPFLQTYASHNSIQARLHDNTANDHLSENGVHGLVSKDEVQLADVFKQPVEGLHKDLNEVDKREG
ncbi:hypothetical protein KEM56_003514 [Ascosphaera pollenicola]|nr:hypothetical protein KEM56_003514 [Ascosphaera pollenicola]